MSTPTDNTPSAANGQHTAATADPIRIRDHFKLWEILLWAAWQCLNLIGLGYAVFYLFRGGT